MSSFPMRAVGEMDLHSDHGSYVRRCTSCNGHTEGCCDWTCPPCDPDGTWRCPDFELTTNARHLECIIRAPGKVQEYGRALAESVYPRGEPGEFRDAFTGVYVDYNDSPHEFCIALAALTPEQRAEVARKVLEEGE